MERVDAILEKYLEYRRNVKEKNLISSLRRFAANIDDRELLVNLSLSFQPTEIASEATEEWRIAVIGLNKRQKMIVDGAINSVSRVHDVFSVGGLRRIPFNKLVSESFMGEKKSRFLKSLFPGRQNH